MMDPLWILLLAVVVVIVLITCLRWNPFLALLVAALLVSFLAVAPPGADGAWVPRVTRVAQALGTMAGKIAILISMGAIIGVCMTASGAADRIVASIAAVFGRKRMDQALLSGGFLLSIPVFYDATFYLLLPLAKGIYRLTQKNYLLYLLAIGFGATLSHTLIPPTPGPLMVAENMGLSVGTMLLFSGMIGITLAPCALGIAKFINWYFPNPVVTDPAIREELGLDEGPHPCEVRGQNVEEPPRKLPPLWASVLPIVLPVGLIALGTVVGALTKNGTLVWTGKTLVWGRLIAFLGDAQVALMLSAAVSVVLLACAQRLSLREVEGFISRALHSAGMIILITSAGGAFGTMLKDSGVGERIQALMASSGGEASGVWTLALAFGVAAMLKTAQGSSTVAMVVTSGIFASMSLSAQTLGFHPAYVAVVIGVGSCVTGWMNDSGFCIFAQMSGVREVDALRTWTVGLALLGLCGLVVTLVFSQILPMCG